MRVGSPKTRMRQALHLKSAGWARCVGVRGVLAVSEPSEKPQASEGPPIPPATQGPLESPAPRLRAPGSPPLTAPSAPPATGVPTFCPAPLPGQAPSRRASTWLHANLLHRACPPSQGSSLTPLTDPCCVATWPERGVLQKWVFMLR